MSDQYSELRNHYDIVGDVAVSSGRGAQGLKVAKKMFAMLYKGQLLLKLPAERVDELIASGDAGHTTLVKTMRDRVLIPDTKKAAWLDLCEESWRFAESK